jgi:ketosteroid isomerase-like protein
MDQTHAFLTATMPRLREAETALHNGHAEKRIAMWSHDDPVTLFGVAIGGSGWTEIEPIFQHLGASFSDCSSFDNEVIAAGASDDLAYTVAYEHTTASIGGGPPSTYALRVTTVFRREDGEWKVIHRHADSLTSPAAGDVMQQLASGFEISRSASGPSPPSQERR